jgi:hypothetical protein
MITPSFGLTATERVLPRLALDWTTGSSQPGVDVTRAGVATFVGSNGLIQSATADTQRIDYSTGVAGLLIEESRTNAAIYSNDFRNTAAAGETRLWFWTRVSIEAVDGGTTLSPDGTANASKLVENTDTATHNLGLTAQSFTSGTSYTYTIFVKAAERSTIRIVLPSGAFGASVAYNFNLSNGAVSLITAGTGNSASTQSLSNGWYRCRITAQATSTTTGDIATFLVVGGITYQGDGTSGVYIYGAQLEAGAFPTSYIPTTTAALTRNADVAMMTGTNFSDWFNGTAGTVVTQTQMQWLYNQNGKTRYISQLQGTTGLILYFNNNNQSPNIYDGTNLTAGSNVSPLTNAFKYAASWGSNLSACANAGNVNSSAAYSGTFTSATGITIGTDLCGWIKNFYFYPQKLTSSELRSFTK